MKKHTRAIATLLLACLGPGCGGGTAPEGPPLFPGQITIDPASSASVIDFGFGFPVIVDENWPLQVGDVGGTDGLAVGVLRFDLTPLPQDAVITRARLRLYWTGTVGSPASLGPTRVDHVDWTGGSATIDLLTGDTLAPAVATVVFPTTTIIGQPSTALVDLTQRVAADVAVGRSTSAFRIREDTANNGDPLSDARNLGGTFSGNGLFYVAELLIDYLAP